MMTKSISDMMVLFSITIMSNILVKIHLKYYICQKK